MMIVRDVFQARFGQGDALVALFRELEQIAPPQSPFRILVDASGPFFIVVTETTFDDFAAFQSYNAREMAKSGFAEWFQRMTAVVESGRREFYTVVKS